MSRHGIALALFIAAAVCFAVALASIVGTAVGLVVERLR